MRQVISDPADFPSVTIYREERKGGPLYTVAFWNKEQAGHGILYLCVAVLWGGIIAGIYDPDRYSWLFVSGIVAIPVAFLSGLPWPRRRAIELDFASGDLRVKKGNWVTFRQRLGVRKIELAIERHPYAYDEKKQWLAKRLLCLVAYFGLAGADRKILITRWEWPPQGSLMEVQAAVLYAWKLGMHEHNQKAMGRMRGPQLPGGMAPPLE